MIRAIVFDCFGVVISDALSILCGERLADSPEAIRDVWGWIEQANKGLMSSDEASTHIAGVFGMDLEQYRATLTSQEQKDQALLCYISELRSSYKTAMLSNVGAGSLGRRFDPGELERYFDAVVASGDVGYAKPEPRVYEIVAERLDVTPAECIFVDDRQQYCEGAAAVGMQTVLYQNLPQCRAALESMLSADTQQ